MAEVHSGPVYGVVGQPLTREYLASQLPIFLPKVPSTHLSAQVRLFMSTGTCAHAHFAARRGSCHGTVVISWPIIHLVHFSLFRLSWPSCFRVVSKTTSLVYFCNFSFFGVPIIIKLWSRDLHRCTCPWGICFILWWYP